MMKRWKGLQGALLSVLLMLSFAITAGCATQTRPPAPAVKCDKPPLRGPTWADVAILSVEQAAAIDVCNVRNGTDVYKPSPKAMAPAFVPSPIDCGYVGVQVSGDAEATGMVIAEHQLYLGEGPKYCGQGSIGCAVPQGGNTYAIYYENRGWVKMHELCHAYYETGAHTLGYLATRDRIK